MNETRELSKLQLLFASKIKIQNLEDIQKALHRLPAKYLEEITYTEDYDQETKF